MSVGQLTLPADELFTTGLNFALGANEDRKCRKSSLQLAVNDFIQWILLEISSEVGDFNVIIPQLKRYQALL